MIDNKFRLRLVRKNKYVKTLAVRNPLFFDYDWEQKVTNGLGYDLMMEEFERKYIETEGDLIRHLGDMDLLVAKRENQFEIAIKNELFCAVSGLDSSYREVMGTFKKVAVTCGDVIDAYMSLSDSILSGLENEKLIPSKEFFSDLRHTLKSFAPPRTLT